MKIVDLLKSDEYQARLSLSNAWLYYDEDVNDWVVMHTAYHHRAKEYARTNNEEIAVRYLLEAHEE